LEEKEKSNLVEKKWNEYMDAWAKEYTKEQE
jgi:hypothetical protein